MLEKQVWLQHWRLLLATPFCESIYQSRYGLQTKVCVSGWISAKRVVTLVLFFMCSQTDMMDLLGSDLPVDGGSGGQFHWSDGVFLKV